MKKHPKYVQLQKYTPLLPASKGQLYMKKIYAIADNISPNATGGPFSGLQTGFQQGLSAKKIHRRTAKHPDLRLQPL